MSAEIKIYSIFVALAFIAHISVLSPAKAQEQKAWFVASATGSSQVASGSAAWQPLGVGSSVKVGDRIRTGNDGHVVLTRDDESVTIGSASSFEMKDAGNGMMTRIFQQVGTLMFKFHKRPNKHFEVQTPYLVAAVKGTTFTVNIDAAGGAVHVTEGLVEVGGMGSVDKVLVHPGKTASVAAGNGSKVQIGITPSKGKPSHDKQSKGPRIKSDMGAGPLNIEKSSHGLFRGHDNPGQTQSANSNAGGNGKSEGNAFGKDKSLNASLGNGLGLGNGNGGGNGNSNAGGNGNGGAAGGNAGGNGNAYGQGGGAGNGNGNGNGNGKGKP